MLKETSTGVVIPIKVIPKSHRNEIVGWENGELKVRITAAPEKGNANEALIRFLAKYFHLSPSCLTLVYGPASRHKRICISGLTLKEATQALSIVLSDEKPSGR